MKDLALLSAILTIIRKVQIINKSNKPKESKYIQKKEF